MLNATISVELEHFQSYLLKHNLYFSRLMGWTRFESPCRCCRIKTSLQEVRLKRRWRSQRLQQTPRQSTTQQHHQVKAPKKIKTVNASLRIQITNFQQHFDCWKMFCSKSVISVNNMICKNTVHVKPLSSLLCKIKAL